MAPRTKKIKTAKKVNLRQTAFTRFTLIVAVLVLWMGGIGVRLVHLQVTKHEWLKERAEGQRQDVKRSKLPRGTILDRNDRTLAMSVKVNTLYADPTKIDDTKAAAKAIAKVLNRKEGEVAKQLSDGKADEKRFVALARDLDEDTFQKVNKELEDVSIRKPDLPRFAGLHWREGQKRSYPYKTLAAHIIGFSNAEGVGQAGIEQSQNDILFGAVIKKLQERDRLGRIYDETVSEKEPPKDIVLTISTQIQYMTEQALEKAVKASSSKSGIAVVLDNKTGEVLAMANYPTFDPGKLHEITADNLSNAAIQGIYSPGSAMKLVTYSTALEHKLITPEAEIDSGNGSIEIAKHRFTDSHAIGRVTYSKALAQSSNVCAIKTAMRVGKEGFYQSLKNYGFGKPTGIELPAETGGIVRALDRWNGDSLASMSIGYEIGVSALQMASAFATIANNGVRIQPHIIKEIRLSNDQIVPAAPIQTRQVVSAETARDMRKMLREVVVSGTAKRAQLVGYTSAGKTGTAWKFDEKLKKVNSAKYVSSFIGFAPAEDPAVTIAVVMDEPKVGGRDGGQVAGPVFREIAQQILPEMNIKPEGYVAEETSDEVIPESPAGGGPSAISLNDVVSSSNVEASVPATASAKTETKTANSTAKTANRVERARPADVKPQPKPTQPPKSEERSKSQVKNKSSTEKKKGKT